MSKKPKQATLFTPAQPAVPVVRKSYTYFIPHPTDDNEVIKATSLNEAYTIMKKEHFKDSEAPSFNKFKNELSQLNYYQFTDTLKVKRF